LPDRFHLFIKLGSGGTKDPKVIVVFLRKRVGAVVSIEINIAHPAKWNYRYGAIKIVEEDGILAPINVRAGLWITESAIFECHHGAGKELALAGSAAQGPVDPYQCAVCLKELEVIRQVTGTGVGVQHVCELDRKPLGVIAVVIVPLTDDVAIGGVQRDIPELAEGQLFCLRKNKTDAVEGKISDVALERTAEADFVVTHDYELPLRVGLVGIEANRTSGEGEPTMGHHQTADLR
jgi:hypothetical protein